MYFETSNITAQTILCWRSRLEPDTGGEFALLDPATHRFVSTCSGSSAPVIDVSGSLLVPCTRLEDSNEKSSSSINHFPRESLGALGGAIRVLHGGDSAKIRQLHLGEEGCNAPGGSTTVPPVELEEGSLANAGLSEARTAAAIRVQRTWRARRDRRSKRLAAWQDSIFHPYVPGNSPHSSAEDSPSVRDFAQGQTSGHGISGGLIFGDAAAEKLASIARRKRQRRGDIRVVGLSRDDKSKFSVLDSLDALDAADRALQLSTRSGSTSADSREKDRGSCSPKKGLPQLEGRSRQGTSSNDNTNNKNAYPNNTMTNPSAPLEARERSDSESENESAKALLRATDALIRETMPVLRRTRSMQAFDSPPDSPLLLSLCPPSDHAPGRGAQKSAAIAGGAKKAEKVLKQGEGEVGNCAIDGKAEMWEQKYLVGLSPSGSSVDAVDGAIDGAVSSGSRRRKRDSALSVSWNFITCTSTVYRVVCFSRTFCVFSV